MPYSQFDFETAEEQFQLKVKPAKLFADPKVTQHPDWIDAYLKKGAELALLSEKARSELIVMPILLAVRELVKDDISILSGINFVVDTARGLTGECDFLISLGVPLPIVRPPMMAIVEAKKHDIETGLGQCVAQMVAADIFNQRRDVRNVVFGCVTNGEAWQFMKLDHSDLLMDVVQYSTRELTTLLGVFVAIYNEVKSPVRVIEKNL